MFTVVADRAPALSLPTSRLLSAHALQAVRAAVPTVATAVQACGRLRRIRRDPSLPEVLNGTYYCSISRDRQLTDSVQALLAALSGAEGMCAQAAAIAAHRVAHRYGPADGVLPLAAHLYDLIDEPPV